MANESVIDIRTSLERHLTENRALLRHDSAKILTGNSPETYLDNTGYGFKEVFGLDRSMKVVMSLVGDKFKKGQYWIFDEGVYHTWDDPKGRNRILEDELFFEMAALRNELKQKNEAQLNEVLDLKVVEQILDKYFRPNKNIPAVTLEYLREFIGDSYLNVGDPWLVINRRLGREGSATLDYETGQEAGENQVRSVDDLKKEAQRLRFDVQQHTYNGALTELQRAWSESVPSGADAGMKIDHLIIFGNNDPEHKVIGLIDSAALAQEALSDLEADPSEKNFRDAQRAWGRVLDLIEVRRQEWLRQTGEDPDVIKYDTSEGLHPRDIIIKNLRSTARHQVGGLAVLDYYRDCLFPGIINKYLEDLADLHATALTGQKSVDTKALGDYKKEWNGFLAGLNLKPDNYDMFSSDSQFVDLYIKFLLQKGLKIIRDLDPDLYDKIKAEETEEVNEAFPTPIKPSDSQFIKGIFPQTQALRANSYDRIIMHWSFSAHMMDDMTKEELIERVWPELDRLLASGGAVTIVPIGHYEDELDKVKQTLVRFKAITGTRWKVTFTPSRQGRYEGDPLYARDMILRIKKK